MGKTKLTETEVLDIRKRATEGDNLKKLAVEFGVSYDNITAVVAHRSWKHLPGNAPEKINRLEPTGKDFTETRNIKEYDGVYSITPSGKVISNERTVTYVCDGKTRDRTIRERVLKQTINSIGYPVVGLYMNGVLKQRTVHSIVADTYLPPPTEGQTEVRHKDGNRAHPNVDNLERGSRKQNCDDQIRHGTVPQGELNGSAKLTDKNVLEIRAKVTDGKSRRSMAIEYGVSDSTIDLVVNRVRWKHLP